MNLVSEMRGCFHLSEYREQWSRARELRVRRSLL